MKVVIITDTHAGMRSDNKSLKLKQQTFYDKVFFPYLDEHNIQTLIHLGDVFDRRKFINFETLSWWNKTFMKPLDDRNIECHFITGNHDVFYKSTSEVNALSELYSDTYETMSFYWNETKELDFDGTKVLLCPWISPDIEDKLLSEIDSSNAQVLMGHFELVGYSMGRGQLCDHGLDADRFSKFHMVLSGHFHTQSKGKNVHYIGTPYQMTWIDYGEKKGFWVFDTETLELEFVHNPYDSFVKIKYEDSTLTFDQIAELDTSMLKDAFVKVIIINKTNSYLFDLFIDKLNNSGAAEVKIVDDNLHLDDVSDGEILSGAETTEVILRKFIDNLEVNVDKDALNKFMISLYNEALSL